MVERESAMFVQAQHPYGFGENVVYMSMEMQF
jgi:hypothetical protein